MVINLCVFLQTYHHSVSGYVYSVNDRELLIKGFTYDGLGKDAYFWAGMESIFNWIVILIKRVINF